jgi:hypothetical protein
MSLGGCSGGRDPQWCRAIRLPYRLSRVLEELESCMPAELTHRKATGNQEYRNKYFEVLHNFSTGA